MFLVPNELFKSFLMKNVICTNSLGGICKMITFLIHSYCTKCPTSWRDGTVCMLPFSRLSYSSEQHYILFLLKCSTFPSRCNSYSHKLIQIQFQTLLQTSPSLINSHRDLFFFFLFREGNDSRRPMLIRNLLPIPGVRLWFNQQPRRPSHLFHAA